MENTLRLFATFLLLQPSAFAQDTWHVPDQFGTIQAAISFAENGDTVIVREGVYHQWGIDFRGKAIVVKSESGASSTTIDGNATGTIFSFQNAEGSDSVLEGFTLRNGDGVKGGGIYCGPDVSPTIRDCQIVSNTAQDGGGIYCDSGSFPAIVNSLIDSNCSTSGSNSHGHGGGIYCDSSSPTIVNCTISSNVAAGYGSKGGGVYLNDAGSPNIWNSIIWGNDGSASNSLHVGGNGTGILTVAYSCIEGGWVGSGNHAYDPLFTLDPLGGGEHYLSQVAAGQSENSPCWNSGDPDMTLVAGTTRIDGIQDDFVLDMGYHFQVSKMGPTLSVTNLVAGSTASIQVDSCTTDRQVFVAYSLAGGGPTSSPYGTLSLSQPIQLLNCRVADSSGLASWNVPVPSNGGDVDVWIQAFDTASQRLSNGLALTVQ